MFCVRDDSGKKVAKSNCDYEKKPNHRRQCNVHPCPARYWQDKWIGKGSWVEKPWRLSGAVPEIFIRKGIGWMSWVWVYPLQSYTQYGHFQKFNVFLTEAWWFPFGFSWFVSGWSTCSRTCARGKQVRRVHCQHIVEGGETEMIPDDQCPGVKPTIMRTCQMRKLCPDWSTDQWSKVWVRKKGILVFQA